MTSHALQAYFHHFHPLHSSLDINAGVTDLLWTWFMAVLYVQVVFNVHLISCTSKCKLHTLWFPVSSVGRLFLCKSSQCDSALCCCWIDCVPAVYETCCECRCLSVDRSARLQIGVVGRIVSENLPS